MGSVLLPIIKGKRKEEQGGGEKKGKEVLECK